MRKIILYIIDYDKAWNFLQRLFGPFNKACAVDKVQTCRTHGGNVW
jgi:hypothetical protein